LILTLERYITSDGQHPAIVSEWNKSPYLSDLVKNANKIIGLSSQLCSQALFDIVVTSGWRTEALNKAIGGSPKSSHLWAQAIDIAEAKDLERVERARISGAATDQTVCSSSPCTVFRQSGTWISSVTRASTGTYTVNFASGIWSGIPTCTSQAIDNSHILGSQTYNITTSSMGLNTGIASSGAAADSWIDLICMGPR